VERTIRSVSATAAGERLLGRLRPVLDEYQFALDSLSPAQPKNTASVAWMVWRERS
jgi:DNA-binding transcriptional LysR family regulator